MGAVRGCESGRRAAFFKQQGEAVCGIGWIDGRAAAAGEQDAEKSGDHLRAGFYGNRNGIARLHTRFDQPGREARGFGAELLIGECSRRNRVRCDPRNAPRFP